MMKKNQTLEERCQEIMDNSVQFGKDYLDAHPDLTATFQLYRGSWFETFEIDDGAKRLALCMDQEQGHSSGSFGVALAEVFKHAAETGRPAKKELRKHDGHTYVVIGPKPKA